MCYICDLKKNLNEEQSDALDLLVGLLFEKPTLPEYGVAIVPHSGWEEALRAVNAMNEEVEEKKWAIIEDPLEVIPEGTIAVIPCISYMVPNWPTEDASKEAKENALLAARILIAAGVIKE